MIRITRYSALLSTLILMGAIVTPVSGQEGLTPTVPPELVQEGFTLIETALIALLGGASLFVVGLGVITHISTSPYFVGIFERRYSKLSEQQKAAIRAIVVFADEVTDDQPYAGKTPDKLSKSQSFVRGHKQDD